MPRKPAPRKKAAIVKKNTKKPIEEHPSSSTPSPIGDHPSSSPPSLSNPSPDHPSCHKGATRSQPKPSRGRAPSHCKNASAISNATARNSVPNHSINPTRVSSRLAEKRLKRAIGTFPTYFPIKRPRLPQRHAAATLPLVSSSVIASTTLSLNSPSKTTSKSSSTNWSSSLRPQKSTFSKRPSPNKSLNTEKLGRGCAYSSGHIKSEEKVEELDAFEEEKQMIMKVENGQDGHEEENGNSKNEKKLGAAANGKKGEEVVTSTFQVIYMTDDEGEPSVNNDGDNADSDGHCKWDGDDNDNDDEDGRNVSDGYGNSDAHNDDDNHNDNNDYDGNSGDKDRNSNQDGDEYRNDDGDGEGNDDNDDEQEDNDNDNSSDDDNNDDEDGDEDKDRDGDSAGDDDGENDSKKDNNNGGNNSSDCDSNDYSSDDEDGSVDIDGDEDEDSDGKGDSNKDRDHDGNDDDSGGASSSDSDDNRNDEDEDDEEENVSSMGSRVLESATALPRQGSPSTSSQVKDRVTSDGHGETTSLGSSDAYSITRPAKKQKVEGYVYNPFEPRSPQEINASSSLLRSHWGQLVTAAAPLDTPSRSPYNQKDIIYNPAYKPRSPEHIYGWRPSHNQRGPFETRSRQHNHPSSPTSRSHESIQGHALDHTHPHHRNQNLVSTPPSYNPHECAMTASQHTSHAPYMPSQHTNVPSTFYGLGGSNMHIMTGDNQLVIDALTTDTNGPLPCEGFLRAAELDLQPARYTCPSEREERSPPSTHSSSCPGTLPPRAGYIDQRGREVERRRSRARSRANYPSSPQTERLLSDILSPHAKGVNDGSRSPPQV